MAAGSSTLQSNETVTLKLPTGEMVDAIVPGGLSDDAVKSFVQMKRPDLFGAPAPAAQKPQANMQYGPEGLAQTPDPQMQHPTAGLPGSGTGRTAIGHDLIPGAIAGGTAAAVAAPTALPFLRSAWPAAKGAAKATAITTATEAAVQGAKKLPVVGPYISSIPGIDYLPFLVGGLAGGGEKGKSKEPVYPSSPEGPTALPEQLNPALVSESRTLPGQISKEVIRPKASPAQPIPPRAGLALPPAPEASTSALPPALQPQTAKSPGQSAFEQRYPNDQMSSGMSADAERAWQQSNGFKTEPVVDIGAKVRAQAPPLPRGGETPNKLDDLLRNAVGNQPVKPGVKIKDQFKSPEGHTPVESSAITSYKYDPDARELHVAGKGGTVYTYGDVSPDDAQAFQAADSKGKAWQAIKQSSALVKKNGKPVRPSDTGEDLTPVLQQMLDQAKAKKN